MEDWIIYGLIASVLIAVVDLCRKYIVTTVNPYVTVIIPLFVAGILSLIMLGRSGIYNDIKKLTTSQYCLLLGIGISIPIVHYLITKSLQAIHNPGYAKTIISLNILISLFASTYLFNSASVNSHTIIGVILVTGGTYLIINKA